MCKSRRCSVRRDLAVCTTLHLCQDTWKENRVHRKHYARLDSIGHGTDPELAEALRSLLRAVAGGRVFVSESTLSGKCTVILVTVGTTLPFDDLVRAVDQLVERGDLQERVICQIGHGAYQPQHCDYFRFAPSLESYIEEASLVIGHGGTGTVTGLLAIGKPFIAVANPLGANNHQAQFLARLSSSVPFLWTTNPANLLDLIAKAVSTSPSARSGMQLTDDLKAYLMNRPF